MPFHATSRPALRADVAADIELARKVVVALSRVVEPLSIWIRPPTFRPTWSAILSGSFNPPTTAHVLLAEAARQFGLDSIVYLLPLRSVDKERVEVLRVEDRIVLLDQIAVRTGTTVALANRGLYVDQARLIQSLLPETRLTFVVGFDKILQIFDPRYYDDRDQALDELFAIADVLIAPRGESGSGVVREFIGRPDLARWRDKMTELRVQAELDPELSSSAIRSGSYPESELSSVVPPEVKLFLEHRRPFADPARYLAGDRQSSRQPGG